MKAGLSVDQLVLAEWELREDEEFQGSVLLQLECDAAEGKVKSRRAKCRGVVSVGGVMLVDGSSSLRDKLLAKCLFRVAMGGMARLSGPSKTGSRLEEGRGWRSLGKTGGVPVSLCFNGGGEFLSGLRRGRRSLTSFSNSGGGGEEAEEQPV